MIKLILGGIGSGKSLTSVREIIRRNQDRVFGNFDVRGVSNYTRLKISDVLLHDEKGKACAVNWEFWNDARKKYGGFHIILDEIHNIMHSRRSMSKENIQLSAWFSQIRKVTGANETYDLIAISQALERIDVSIRDLAHEIVHCTKVVSQLEEWTEVLNTKGKVVKQKLPVTYVFLHYFRGMDCVLNYNTWRVTGEKTYSYRMVFKANSFYKYYDSYAFITFGEDGYLA